MFFSTQYNILYSKNKINLVWLFQAKSFNYFFFKKKI